MLSIASEASGVSGVFVGVIAALAVVYYRERNFRSLGFRKPARWATVPLWIVGMLGLYYLAQTWLPPLISNFVEVPEPDVSKYDAIVGNLGAAVTTATLLGLPPVLTSTLDALVSPARFRLRQARRGYRFGASP